MQIQDYFNTIYGHMTTDRNIPEDPSFMPIDISHAQSDIRECTVALSYVCLHAAWHQHALSTSGVLQTLTADWSVQDPTTVGSEWLNSKALLLADSC